MSIHDIGKTIPKSSKGRLGLGSMLAQYQVRWATTKTIINNKK